MRRKVILGNLGSAAAVILGNLASAVAVILTYSGLQLKIAQWNPKSQNKMETLAARHTVWFLEIGRTHNFRRRTPIDTP